MLLFLDPLGRFRCDGSPRARACGTDDHQPAPQASPISTRPISCGSSEWATNRRAVIEEAKTNLSRVTQELLQGWLAGTYKLKG
jgi:hypothetical protein